MVNNFIIPKKQWKCKQDCTHIHSEIKNLYQWEWLPSGILRTEERGGAGASFAPT